MRDADQQYPHQKLGGNGSRQPFDDDTEVEYDDKDELQESVSPQLPQNRFTKALIVGIVAGLLCAIQSVVITLVNSSTYQTYVTSGTQQTVQNAVALTLFGLACLTFSISMLICFIAGFVIGKVAVLRRMGFLTGFIAGAIIYSLSFLLNYIPGYPTHLTSSGVRGLVGVGSGILVSLIFLLVWGVIGGLASLAGAWLATRKHPYYYASQGS
ncbi:MAG TPA: YrzE family protein [Ktedonobacteraceae bacterium]